MCTCLRMCVRSLLSTQPLDWGCPYLENGLTPLCLHGMRGELGEPRQSHHFTWGRGHRTAQRATGPMSSYSTFLGPSCPMVGRAPVLPSHTLSGICSQPTAQTAPRGLVMKLIITPHPILSQLEFVGGRWVINP